MMHEYVEFTEQYKGFTLETIKYRLSDRGSYHKQIRVSKDGKGLAIGKTKKEVKELIDLNLIHDGYIKRVAQ